MKRIGLIVQVFFYLFAGFNHFRDPGFYLDLIPGYLPYHSLINISSGVIEIFLGLFLIFPSTRSLGAYGIMLMLIAFIPSHIYFIQVGSCVQDGLCVPEWIGWGRLIIIHPLLIWWAWVYRK